MEPHIQSHAKGLATVCVSMRLLPSNDSQTLLFLPRYDPMESPNAPSKNHLIGQTGTPSRT